MLDAELEEEISLASAHTPEEGEGSEQEEECQELARKKRRLKKVASTASTLESEQPTELDDDDSRSSSPIARDPVAVAPLRMAPPASAPGFTRFVDVHSLVDDDDDDDRYAFAHHSLFSCIVLSYN